MYVSKFFISGNPDIGADKMNSPNRSRLLVATSPIMR